MKKVIFFLVLCFYSCKQNNNENNSYVSDSSAVVKNEYVIDSTAAIPLEPIEEIPTRELTYEEVLETSSQILLEDFILKNPDHENIEKLKSRLIDLEVNAILNDERTGKMPVSDKISESNSRISEVSIQNDTSCNLEVRYSGVESKMISIPANQSATISLKSGSYRVAASACGSNYAGSENLRGNYSSSYYIVTSYR